MTVPLYVWASEDIWETGLRGMAFLENLSAMARVQHVSNTGVYSSNPGVNLIMIGLWYQF